MRPGAFTGARSRPCRAFTMVEIAIAVAVIAFALVAIIGVLPAGLQVQKENREDTLIAQEGVYWMEAIRSGAEGLDELVNYVEPNSLMTNGVKVTGQYTAPQIIGSLSVPTPFGGVPNSVVMRALSGSVADKGATPNDLSFKYKLDVQVSRYDPGTNQVPQAILLPSYLYDLRLTFNWPVVGTRIGNSRQVFRSLVSGTLLINTNSGLYFFRP